MHHTGSNTNSSRNFYFNRLPSLWNILPPINLQLSVQSIKDHLFKYFFSTSWTTLFQQILVHFTSFVLVLITSSINYYCIFVVPIATFLHVKGSLSLYVSVIHLGLILYHKAFKKVYHSPSSRAGLDQYSCSKPHLCSLHHIRNMLQNPPLFLPMLLNLTSSRFQDDGTNKINSLQPNSSISNPNKPHENEVTSLQSKVDINQNI